MGEPAGVCEGDETMNPTLIVDTETTGLPGKTPDNLLHIVEVGCAVVDRWGDVCGSWGVIVNPGEDVVADPSVRPALDVSGLTPQIIVERGIRPAVAAKRMIRWLAMLPAGVHWTAFNRNFDAGMLDRGPWPLVLHGMPMADCLMLRAMAVMERHCDPDSHEGPLVWMGSKYKWPKAFEAIDWLRERGHEIPEMRHHRAVDDAVMEAGIAVALEVEEHAIEIEEEGARR